MYQPGFILKTEADFDNAIWMASHVELWQRGELVHQGGIAETQTAFWVRIGGAIYFKYSYEFRVSVQYALEPESCKRIQ